MLGTFRRVGAGTLSLVAARMVSRHPAFLQTILRAVDNPVVGLDRKTFELPRVAKNLRELLARGVIERLLGAVAGPCATDVRRSRQGSYTFPLC